MATSLEIAIADMLEFDLNRDVVYKENMGLDDDVIDKLYDQKRKKVLNILDDLGWSSSYGRGGEWSIILDGGSFK